MNTILNHNVALTTRSLAIDLKDHPDAQKSAIDMLHKAGQLGYQTPLQVHADLFAVQHAIGQTDNKDISDGVQAVGLAAQLPTKLPVIDTKALENNSAPQPLVKAAEQANQNITHPQSQPQSQTSNLPLQPTV